MLSSLTPDQHQKLEQFIKRILADKIINEIQKLMFDQHFYCRFLKSQDFEIEKAITQLKLYLQWRKEMNVDTILVSLTKKINYLSNLCFRTMILLNITISNDSALMAFTMLIIKADPSLSLT